MHKRMNDWLTGSLTDWLTEWMNERTKEWMNACKNKERVSE